MPWKGDITNPIPNIVQEPDSRSEKIINDNRAEQVRRDKDTQKDFTITLYDIDETILLHLEQLQLQIEDIGKQVKVPIFYGSPERWVSAQRDGYIRDNQGKVILPAMVLKRTTSESDSTLQFFNRYLNTPVMKLYSEKNQYTRFAALIGKNVPVNEIYNVVVPSHMILTYHFIIWTALVEQMNKLVQDIQFNTKDYWGSKKGFRFRTRIDTFSHTVEIQAGDDRIVKTEFDLITHGYILPDMMTKLENHKMTTQKMLSPKKMIIGLEVVRTDFDLSTFDPNREKWRRKDYPNLQADVVIPPPPISLNNQIIDNSQYEGIQVDRSPLFLRIVPIPSTSNAGGQEGDISYDKEYFYIHIHGEWKRVAISQFTPVCPENVPLTGTPGSVISNADFFYIYTSGKWRKVAVSEVDLTDPGEDGNVMYDKEYFYIYTSGSWRRTAISSIT